MFNTSEIYTRLLCWFRMGEIGFRECRRENRREINRAPQILKERRESLRKGVESLLSARLAVEPIPIIRRVTRIIDLSPASDKHPQQLETHSTKPTASKKSVQSDSYHW